ncbi:uncharacterized protein RSE6_09627 [Rhynchosporium secalis]|uniref:Uncharacterized protein n=1 Tax=Rhynchosporium secalis TaxID=38038 RepID=A0A1E1MJH9_RHYSE|nr:uncharacterized protein RSE6_09627 [Rhynchosporium secalis]
MAPINREVIDLTADSDDEDISWVLPVADRNNFLPSPAGMPSQTLTVNGLPDPTGFPDKVITEGRGGSFRTTTTTSKHGVALSGSTQVNSIKKRPLLPTTKLPVAYKDENTGVGPSGSRATSAINLSSKRRKLDDGKSQPIPQNGRRISPGPILPPSYTRPQTTSAQKSSNMEVVLPANASGSPGTLSASRTPGSSSNINPNRQTLSKSGVLSPAMEPEMKRVLEQQVLPHVHEAVGPYRVTLNYAERTEIGQSVASRLVTGTAFMAHYVKNNKTMTPAFESQIKLSAYNLVNQAVANLVQKRLQEEGPGPATQAGGMSVSYNVLKSSVETSENGSSPPSEELEAPTFVNKKRRAISISTSTSFSTDAETGSQLGPLDGNQSSGAEGYRSRRAAAILPQGAYQSLKRPRRSAAEMEQDAARSRAQANSEGRSKNTIKAGSSLAPRPVQPARIQQLEVDKPKRTRRTKAQMEEARRTEGRSTPAGTNPYSRTQNEPLGSHPAPALAQGNVARPYMQQPSFQSSRHSGYGDIPIIDDPARQPYISSANRDRLQKYVANPAVVNLLSEEELNMLNSNSMHVPFSSDEITLLLKIIVEQGGGPKKLLKGNPTAWILKIMKDNPTRIPKILQALQNPERDQKKKDLLRTRDVAAIEDFLQDAINSAIDVPFKLCVTTPHHGHLDPLMTFLRERQRFGMTPCRSRRGRSTFTVLVNNHLEDALVRQSEWTDCSGDISSISWTGPDSFICGALAHSDAHNMQYNKPGNLLVGSTSLDVVKSYPDHRVIRPLVANEGDKENANALESMRTTQSPWMYESVVSTAHCEANGFSFTASFDKTVKVWSISEAGSGMNLRGTWQHHEKVNFVTASSHHDRVATACATNGFAVRVYTLNQDAISLSPYQQYCGDKSDEGADEMGMHTEWSYQPATMQWGKSAGVKDFLLVGYSPRSITGNDNNVPELKRNTGEIALWNTSSGEQIFLTSPKTQNVFEVIWHPSQPIFLAATSPHGPCDPVTTKTQIRIFHQQENGHFKNMKNLDCPAIDINELTIKANSTIECFVTASCTDGFTYVWDTGRGDQPTHALQHGETLDNPDPDLPLDVGDSGIKFAAWGRSLERFYTGGSDGVVKAWNLKASRGNVFIRNVLTISGGISTGIFNADCSKLLIGDATGKIYLLSIDDSDIKEDSKPPGPVRSQALIVGSQLSRGIRRPKLVVPHCEPSPPSGYIIEEVEKSGVEISRELISSAQLLRIPQHRNLVFQGPNYWQTNLFRREAHFDFNPSQPLFDDIWAMQQVMVNSHRDLPFHPKLQETIHSSSAAQHLKNINQNNANFRRKTGFEWDRSNISSELWTLLDNGRLLKLAEDIIHELPYEHGFEFSMFDDEERISDPAARACKGLLTSTYPGGDFVEEEEEDDMQLD